MKNQIKNTKKNIIGYRNIYLVSYDGSLQIDDCITINERIYPFTIETVQKYNGKSERNGWYLQQLLKLYAGFVIPNILDKYLVIDSDTYFLKPTTFIMNNKYLYNFGTEYHKPYFTHMNKLHHTLKRVYPNKSGICHHMIFETKYIKELFKLIEGKSKFYDLFLQNIVDYSGSGASEYEIYFNYMITNYPEKIIIRELNWANVNSLPKNSNNDYVSCHWYMRK